MWDAMQDAMQGTMQDAMQAVMRDAMSDIWVEPLPTADKGMHGQGRGREEEV